MVWRKEVSPGPAKGGDLDYRNDGGTAVVEADMSVTFHGRGPSGGRDALYASLLKLLHFRKSLFLSWKRRLFHSGRLGVVTPWTVAHHPFLQGSYILIGSFPGGSDGKESVCNARDVGLIPGLGRSSRTPGEGNGNPTPVFLENPMDRGAWGGHSPELQRVGHY